MTTATSTWPTAAALEEAAQRLADAVTALDELGHFHGLVDDLQNPDPPTPTLEQFGAVSWFIANAEEDIKNLTHHLEPIREACKLAAYTMRTAPSTSTS